MAKKVAARGNVGRAQELPTAPRGQQPRPVDLGYTAEDSRIWEESERAKVCFASALISMTFIVHIYLVNFVWQPVICSSIAILASLFAVKFRVSLEQWRAIGFTIGILYSVAVIFRVVDLSTDSNCLTGEDPRMFCVSLRHSKTMPHGFFGGLLGRSIMVPVITRLRIRRTLVLIGLQFGIMVIFTLAISPVTALDGATRRCQWFTWLMIVCAVCIHSRHEAKDRNARDEIIRHLRVKHNAERVMSHHIKNVLAEAMATLVLFLDAKSSVAVEDLKRTVNHLKGGVLFLQQSLELAKIQEGLHVARARTVHLREWILSHAIWPVELTGCNISLDVLDSLVADLFIALSLGNCNTHGAGDTRVDCTYAQGLVHINVHNSMVHNGNATAADSRLAQFSTGLGITDLERICQTLGIAYSNHASTGRWHAEITLAAHPVQKVAGAVMGAARLFSKLEEKDGEGECLPPNIRVAVIDDQAMIPRMVKMKIKKQCASAQVEVYRINNADALRRFRDTTIPNRARLWDIVILDQHMPIDDQPGAIQTGTGMLPILAKHGCNALMIMHTGNTTAKDTRVYTKAGAHGTISKGTSTFTEELLALYIAHQKKKL